LLEIFSDKGCEESVVKRQLESVRKRFLLQNLNGQEMRQSGS